MAVEEHEEHDAPVVVEEHDGDDGDLETDEQVVWMDEGSILSRLADICWKD